MYFHWIYFYTFREIKISKWEKATKKPKKVSDTLVQPV